MIYNLPANAPSEFVLPFSFARSWDSKHLSDMNLTSKREKANSKQELHGARRNEQM